MSEILSRPHPIKLYESVINKDWGGVSWSKYGFAIDETVIWVGEGEPGCALRDKIVATLNLGIDAVERFNETAKPTND